MVEREIARNGWLGERKLGQRVPSLALPAFRTGHREPGARHPMRSVYRGPRFRVRELRPRVRAAPPRHTAKVMWPVGGDGRSHIHKYAPHTC